MTIHICIDDINMHINILTSYLLKSTNTWCFTVILAVILFKRISFHYIQPTCTWSKMNKGCCNNENKLPCVIEFFLKRLFACFLQNLFFHVYSIDFITSLWESLTPKETFLFYHFWELMFVLFLFACTVLRIHLSRLIHLTTFHWEN